MRPFVIQRKVADISHDIPSAVSLSDTVVLEGRDADKHMTSVPDSVRCILFGAGTQPPAPSSDARSRVFRE